MIVHIVLITRLDISLHSCPILDHRWVRMAAFQQLGPFISTFAETEEKISENEDSSCLLSESTTDNPKSQPKDDKEEDNKKRDGGEVNGNFEGKESSDCE